MRNVSAAFKLYLQSAEVMDWFCVWAALTIFAFFVLPYGPYAGAPLLLNLVFTLGVSAGITFLMAGTLYLFRMVSQLSFATKASLASLVVAAFFAPFIGRIPVLQGQTNELSNFRNFLILFGLSALCYAWLWALQTYRSKSDQVPIDAPIENPFEQHELLHVHSQIGAMKVATLRGTEIWDFPMDAILPSLNELGGLRVHKDHWVSDKAVQGYGKNAKGDMVIALINQSFVPVSETYAKTVANRYKKLMTYRS